MKHGRKEYHRIADPAANAELLAAYDAAMGVVARGPTTITARNIGASLTGTIQEVAEELRAAYVLLSRLTRSLHPQLSIVVGLDAVKIEHPIAVDEPVFLLRARDLNAPDAVRRWAKLTEQRGGASAAIVRAAADHADLMERYGRAHGAHVADL